jgi:hypothetical protein
MLLAAAMSDAGTMVGLWLGPQILYFGLFAILSLLKVLVPLALATGCLAWLEPSVQEEVRSY